MYHTGNGGAPAVVDIGHGTGNGSGDRDSPEERNHDIGGSLCDKLGIGVGLVASYTVGDGSRQKGFYGSQYGDGKCRRE